MFVRIPIQPRPRITVFPTRADGGSRRGRLPFPSPRTPISDVSRITCATVAPLREIPSPAFMKRCTTTPSRRPFSLSFKGQKKVAAVMSGHDAPRDSQTYAAVTLMARARSRKGFFHDEWRRPRRHGSDPPGRVAAK